MLDPLIEAIETVKKRIEQHQQTLSENETRTRVALIDPILKALGWDPADSALVTLEYNVAELRADYALHSANAEDKPAAIIEAKKLGESLDGKPRRQVLTYVFEQDIGYGGLTDGDKWELYNVFASGDLNERRIDVSISKDEPHACAVKLLTLWRPNLASGNVGVVDHEDDDDDEPDPDPNWVPLSEFRPQIGDPRPSAIRLPGESGRDIKYWNEILMTTAEWLCQKNSLKPVLISPIAKTYIVSDSVVGIRNPGSIDNGRYYVEKDVTCVEICRNARTLLKHCGKDPSEVYLKPADVDGGNGQ